MDDLSIDEKAEIIRFFLCDSREMLDDVEPQIVALETSALSTGKIDGEVLNAIFRLFHSLKGSASLLNFLTIASVTHEAETLLDIFRKGRAFVKTEHVNLLMRTCDFIRNTLGVLELQMNDKGFENEAKSIVKDLQKAILSVSAEEPNSTEAINSELELIITAEMISRFTQESNEFLDEAEKMLLVLEKEPGRLDYAGQAFRALHSFKGNSGLLGYADLEEVAHCAENLLDKIRSGEKSCDPVTISFLLIATDSLREGLHQISIGSNTEIYGKKDIIKHLQNLAGEAGKGAADSEQIQPAEPGKSEKSLSSQLSSLKPGDIVFGTSTVLADPAEAAEGREIYPSADKTGQQQVIRVDTDKLDKLLDLVGELVIAEAIVANQRGLGDVRPERFEKAILQLDKITRDIQEVAISMRMIPLSGTFKKMVRLVRDLSHKTGKKVALEICGEETEVDKTVIEQLSDPLVHLVRNALDHGIESPEERLAAGKPETGRVRIQARHSAGEVWIMVEDDGSGLNREKILKKGVARGLIPEEDPEIKDEEIWRLIFEPGFSTAENVSSISGRGVGMDVVRRNIENLRGKVDVRSNTGSGTMFIMRIPLTLAIIEGMVVRVGHSRYIIPIHSIKKSLQPRPDQITLMPGGLEVVNIRGELLPVVRLHEIYQIEPVCRKLTDGILIVLEGSERKCCLFVDELIGQQQIVIKGLSSYLGHVKSISGCAVLGDGAISMILDIDGLINCLETRD